MSEQNGPQRKIKVWDLPLRLFHWLLVLLIIGSFVSESMDNLELHSKIGYTVLCLLLFRLLWGALGGTHARFASFVKGPAAIKAYLLAQRDGKNDAAPGHNPLGALSVLGLLGVLLLQGLSGLFTSTDEFFEGPLAKLVSSSLSEGLTEFHEFNSTVVLVLIGLHLAAILFYRFVKRDNLVLPMLTGKKLVPQDSAAQDAEGGGVLKALLLLGVSALAVWFVVTRL